MPESKMAVIFEKVKQILREERKENGEDEEECWDSIYEGHTCFWEFAMREVNLFANRHGFEFSNDYACYNKNTNIYLWYESMGVTDDMDREGIYTHEKISFGKLLELKDVVQKKFDHFLDIILPGETYELIVYSTYSR